MLRQPKIDSGDRRHDHLGQIDQQILPVEAYIENAEAAIAGKNKTGPQRYGSK